MRRRKARYARGGRRFTARSHPCWASPCDNRRDDRIRPYLRTQREGPIGLRLVFRCLHKVVAPREVHPIEDFEARMRIEAFHGRSPALINFDAANRAVQTAMAWTLVSGSERGPNPSDEDQRGVDAIRRASLDLSRPFRIPVHACAPLRIRPHDEFVHAGLTAEEEHVGKSIRL